MWFAGYPCVANGRRKWHQIPHSHTLTNSLILTHSYSLTHSRTLIEARPIKCVRVRVRVRVRLRVVCRMPACSKRAAQVAPNPSLSLTHLLTHSHSLTLTHPFTHSHSRTHSLTHIKATPLKCVSVRVRVRVKVWVRLRVVCRARACGKWAAHAAPNPCSNGRRCGDGENSSHTTADGSSAAKSRCE